MQIRELKKRLNRKVEIVDKLEKQIENIPVLKKMVKDMDKLLDGAKPGKSMNESGLRTSQRSSKESESHVASNVRRRLTTSFFLMFTVAFLCS